MSSAEWREGLLAWTRAAAVEDALRRILANARISDDVDAMIELQTAMASLTPEQRSVIANRVLEMSSSSLDEELFDNLVTVFGEGRLVNGEFVPVGLDRAQDPRHLTDGEPH